MPRLYFDYNAATPLAPEVSEILIKAYKDDIKNPSSVHQEGRHARKSLEQARARIASLLNCIPDEVYFTSGATEGNNAVLFSTWQTREESRNKIVTTEVEHDSILKPLSELQKKGVKVEFVPVNVRGETDLQAWQKALDDKTFLVSLMLANNETGMLFPVKEVSHLAHSYGALFHTDSACAVGKIPLSFHDLGVDFFVFSAGKFYGPRGVGGMLVKKGVPFSPLIFGGAQERGFRAGTVNVAGLLGLQTALEYSLGDIDNEILRQTRLRDKIKQGLLSLMPGVSFHEGGELNQLPGTINMAFPEFSGQTLIANLDLEGVSASFGSACHSGALEVSRVILAMGVRACEAAGSIRLSFGKMTTEEDVDGLIKAFRKVIRRMNVL